MKHPEWGVSDLARKMALSKTIIFRLLTTLKSEGFLEQNAKTERFRLGTALFLLAATYARQNDLLRLADRFLRELVARTHHTALLAVLDTNFFVVLDVVPSSNVMMINILAGDRKPAHATAGGKVLLAGLPDEAMYALYPSETLTQLTANTIGTRARLLTELAQVRRDGFALNRSEANEGEMAVAAPIRDYEGRTLAAIALSWPMHIVPEDQVPALARQVIATAAEMSLRFVAPAQHLPLFSS